MCKVITWPKYLSRADCAHSQKNKNNLPRSSPAAPAPTLIIRRKSSVKQRRNCPEWTSENGMGALARNYWQCGRAVNEPLVPFSPIAQGLAISEKEYRSCTRHVKTDLPSLNFSSSLESSHFSSVSCFRCWARRAQQRARPNAPRICAASGKD